MINIDDLIKSLPGCEMMELNEFQNLIFDSLQKILIVAELEEKLNIQFSIEEIECINTYADLISLRSRYFPS